jgi:quinol monooxygenase YgiN
MIVVVGRVCTDADKREELMRVARAVAAASRTEAGCIGYRVYEDVDVPNDFVFVEEWENDAALRAHFGTAHISEFMQAIPATITSAPDVKFHTISSSLDLSEVQAG